MQISAFCNFTTRDVWCPRTAIININFLLRTSSTVFLVTLITVTFIILVQATAFWLEGVFMTPSGMITCEIRISDRDQCSQSLFWIIKNLVYAIVRCQSLLGNVLESRNNIQQKPLLLLCSLMIVSERSKCVFRCLWLLIDRVTNLFSTSE